MGLRGHHAPSSAAVNGEEEKGGNLLQKEEDLKCSAFIFKDPHFQPTDSCTAFLQTLSGDVKGWQREPADLGAFSSPWCPGFQFCIEICCGTADCSASAFALYELFIASGSDFSGIDDHSSDAGKQKFIIMD